MKTRSAIALLTTLQMSFSALAGANTQIDVNNSCPYNATDAASMVHINKFKEQIEQHKKDLQNRQEDRKKCLGIPEDSTAGLDMSVAASIQQIATGLSPTKAPITTLNFGAGTTMSCTTSTNEMGTIMESYVFNARDTLGGYNIADPAPFLVAQGSDGVTLNNHFKTCYTGIRTAYPSLATTTSSTSSITGESNNATVNPVLITGETNNSGNSQPFQLSGQNGESLEQLKIRADQEFDRCMFTSIYGTPTRPRQLSQTSFAARVWAQNCSTGPNWDNVGNIGAQIDANANSIAKQEQIKGLLQGGFNNLKGVIENLITPPLSGQEDKPECQALHTKGIAVANALIGTASAAAQILGAPWASLAAAVVTQPLQGLIAQIGSKTKDIKSMNETLKLLEPDGAASVRFESYTCMLISAQALSCSKPFDEKSEDKNAVACPTVGPVYSLSESLGKISTALQTERKEDYKNGVADKLRNDLFGKSNEAGKEKGMLLPNGGDRLSIYEYLWGIEENQDKGIKAPIVDKTLKEGLVARKNKNKADFSYNSKMIIKNYEDLKADIDEFKKCMDQSETDTPCKDKENKKKDMDMNAAASALQEKIKKAGSLSGTNENYLESMLKESENSGDTDQQAGMLQISLYELQNNTQTSLFALNNTVVLDDKGQVVSQQVAAKDQDTVTRNQEMVRDTNMKSLYTAYNDLSGKQYMQQFVVKPRNESNKQKLQKDNTSPNDYKQSEEFYNTVIGPMLKDCVLSYQLNIVNIGSDETQGKKMRDDYQEMCHMFSQCTKSKNTIGLPFEINDQDVHFGTHRAGMEPVCRASSSYPLIEQRSFNEFKSKKTICGKKVTEPDFLLPLEGKAARELAATRQAEQNQKNVQKFFDQQNKGNGINNDIINDIQIKTLGNPK